MYYIRLNRYGQIAWETMGYDNVLLMDRNKPSGSGMCLPKEFDTQEAANKFTNKENNKEYIGKNSYHVEDIDSPFVQNWLEKHSVFYKVENRCIVHNN